MGGDFNIVRFPSKRLRGVSYTQAMHGFSDFIALNRLMHIPMERGLYTWSNTSSESRTDRFLFSPILVNPYTLPSQKRLSTVLSNHFPILLEGESQWRGRIPFRFENIWLKVEEFLDKVKVWWASYMFQGTPSYILAKKLTALKLDLKMWNETEFGIVTF